MAVIHRTTLTPTKLELLTAWLPAQPWYVGGGAAPCLVKAGGFRLDDPSGEVGIEFMAVRDDSGERAVVYHVPMTYRGAPLDGGEDALIGTSEHGVLGPRWIYDGAHDPVLLAQLLALVEGRAEPQAQSLTDTPDPSVHVHPAESAARAGRAPTIRVNRVLEPGEGGGAAGYVSAPWLLPDGLETRGLYAVAV